MTAIKELFINKIRANIALYAALCFIILSFIFSGLYCENAQIVAPENFFAHFFIRTFFYLLIITDAFILSLYKFCIPLAFLTQLFGSCIWGILLKSAFSEATWLVKALFFIPVTFLAAMFCILNAMVMEILLLNFSRSLSLGKVGLPFKQKFLYSINEFKSCMSIFLAMMLEIALSCVISAML